jgi:hypothetical protein
MQGCQNHHLSEVHQVGHLDIDLALIFVVLVVLLPLKKSFKPALMSLTLCVAPDPALIITTSY